MKSERENKEGGWKEKREKKVEGKEAAPRQCPDTLHARTNA
jgi:hypothetical protein